MGKELEEIVGITKNKIEYIKKQPKIDWVYLKYYEGILNLVSRLEAIDNSNPSEALIEVDKILGYFGGDDVQIETMTLSKHNVLKIKQALLKEQEPKHYLKWEDLEFTNEEQTMKVKLKNNIYTMFYYSDEVCFDTVSIAGVFIDSCGEQFFNDLHLEVVEE